MAAFPGALCHGGQCDGVFFLPAFLLCPPPFPFSLLKLLAVEMASQDECEVPEGTRVPWSRSDTAVLGVQPPMSP